MSNNTYTVICGHYGCGKTNLSLNLAIEKYNSNDYASALTAFKRVLEIHNSPILTALIKQIVPKAHKNPAKKTKK